MNPSTQQTDQRALFYTPSPPPPTVLRTPFPLFIWEQPQLYLLLLLCHFHAVDKCFYTTGYFYLLYERNQSSQYRFCPACKRDRNINFKSRAVFFLFLVFSISLSLVGNSGRLTWVGHSSRKSSATHFYQCVEYFRVSKQYYGCQCLEFLTCAQICFMQLHTGAVRTPYESLYWKLTLWRKEKEKKEKKKKKKKRKKKKERKEKKKKKKKKKEEEEEKRKRKKDRRKGDSNQRQYCDWFFNRTHYQLSYPIPF